MIDLSSIIDVSVSSPTRTLADALGMRFVARRGIEPGQAIVTTHEVWTSREDFDRLMKYEQIHLTDQHGVGRWVSL
jgi:hypothetical protein